MIGTTTLTARDTNPGQGECVVFIVISVPLWFRAHAEVVGSTSSGAVGYGWRSAHKTCQADLM